MGSEFVAPDHVIRLGGVRFARRLLGIAIRGGVAWLRSPLSRFEKTWRGSFSDELSHAIGEYEFADFIGTKDLFPGWARYRQLARP